MKVITSIILACLATTCYSRSLTKDITFGNCVDIKTDPKLNLVAFSAAKWFEISRSYNTFEGNSECVQQSFQLDSINSKFLSAFQLRFENGTFGIIQGAVNYTVKSDETMLDAVYPGEEANTFSFDILDTDIDNYAVIYSCRQITNDVIPEMDERVWVLSRTPTLSPDVEDAVYNALIYEGTSLGAGLGETNQNNCEIS